MFFAFLGLYVLFDSGSEVAVVGLGPTYWKNNVYLNLKLRVYFLQVCFPVADQECLCSEQ